MTSFDDFFRRLTAYQPHDWQARLAADSVCRDLLIRIPTGFGKTAGVTIAWLYNRVHRKDDTWPRRLVLCLPMRTLVEQTQREVVRWLQGAGLDSDVPVHVLLGGLTPSDWHLEPDREAVLIGTQDMLLSRALNRGYGSGRARWPMEYGLLHVDCLWVLDEIQLMGVGFVTSAQLQAFACYDEQAGRLARPRRTWWMSATLQPEWFRRAPDLDLDSLPLVSLGTTERRSDLWTAQRTIGTESIPPVYAESTRHRSYEEELERWVELVEEAHRHTRRGITLAIANTVKSAVDLHAALKERLESVDLRLVHSQFRGEERRTWAGDFLAREHCGPGKDRVIVATQVVEAGVDISADALVTEIAPWASLVQRFGRCARYGGTGRIVVIDRRHTDESAPGIPAKGDAERAERRRKDDVSAVAPYELEEVEAAAEAIEILIHDGGGAGLGALEAFEKSQVARGSENLLPRLYQYSPLHVLTQRDLHDFFNTTPDLSGADIDISRFVRDGEERDLTVWWWPVAQEQKPHKRLRPAHNALCRIPLGGAHDWLLGGARHADEAPPSDGSKERPKPVPRAWVWSYLDGDWERLDRRHIYPGQTILVDAREGGYDPNVGFTGKPGTIPVLPAHARVIAAADAADAADEQDEMSEGVGDASHHYKTIATHGVETAASARSLAVGVGLGSASDEAIAVELAGLVHDMGKAHPAFVSAIKDRNGIPIDVPLAKAPKGRWHGVSNMYDHSPLGRRPTFRHELASAIALLELAWRARPDHPALQGGREHVLDATVGRDLPAEGDRLAEPPTFISRLVGLDETTFNLVLYLVMSHHGKVRTALAMSPPDQDNPGPDGDLPIRGIRDGDVLPALTLVDPHGGEVRLQDVTLRLDAAKAGLSPRYGPSWVERVVSLRESYGSFQLAWLEALVRVADVRASRISQPRDARLPSHLIEVPPPPAGEDRDADLRSWIEETLSIAQTEGVTPSVPGGPGRRSERSPRAAASHRRRGRS